MSTSANKLLALCLAAVLSMVLYGCSGGSSEQPDPGPTPAEVQEAADLKAAQDAAAAAEMAAMTAYEAAKTAFMGAEADKAADNTSYVAAEAAMHRAAAAYDDAKAANAAAQSAGTSSEAEAAQANAEAAQARAEAAQMDTEGYAAAITQAKQAQEQEATALSAAQMAAAAAEMAAMTAYNDAKQAVMDIEADKDADMDSYNAAVAARDRAGAAYRDAVRWNSSAQAATTSAAAEQAQRTAEGARDAARAASDEASTEAGMVADAKMKADEAMALNAAKMAANDAATAAETAYNEAKAAVDNAMADATSNALKYAEATRALDKAEAAYMAAMAANTKAQAAATSADAKMYQGQVEAARDDAMSYGEVAENAAGAVTGSGDDERMALDDAKKKAQEAEAAAKKAYDDAMAAVSELEDDGSDAYDEAVKAMNAAMAAHAAAQAANGMAQAATESSVAMIHQRNAENAKMDADNALDDANKYAGMVSDAKALADLKSDAAAAEAAAKLSAEAARTIATNAEDVGGDVHARLVLAAEAAEGHYADAKEANSKAQGATTAAEAQTHLTAAETAAGHAAESEAEAKDDQMIANRLRADREAVALKTAQGAAKTAADKAMEHSNAAKAAADMAGGADGTGGEVKRAQDAYEKAMRGRKNSEGAKAALDEAMKAYTAARAAATRAMNASTDAMAASTSAAGAMMSTEAMTYQTEAEGHRDDAKMAYDGEADGDILSAKAAAMNAENYADMAVEAAGEHVLDLFKQANAYDITADMYDTDRDTVTKTAAKLREEETARVGAALTLTAAATDRGTDVSGTVAWLGTEDEPSVTVTGVTFGDNEAKVEYKEDGPGAFRHRFSVSGPTTDGNSQLLLFSDKEKQIAAVTGVQAKRVDNKEIELEDLDYIKKLRFVSDKVYSGDFDDDKNEATPDLSGRFTCPDGVQCSVTFTTGDDDTVMVSAMSGYRFSGSRSAVTAVEADDQEDYLLFGIWLAEAASSGLDTFGAFAKGGTEEYEAPVANKVTGAARYVGEAVGAHHKTGGAVSYFDGAATLVANFGADDMPGTIEGSVDGIFVDGEEYGDSILLMRTVLTEGQATWTGGDAVMGAMSDPGAAHYKFNGKWEGSFFGPTANDTDTEDVDESHVAPKAAAGTFGLSSTTGSGDDAVTESFVGAFGAHLKP